MDAQRRDDLADERVPIAHGTPPWSVAGGAAARAGRGGGRGRRIPAAFAERPTPRARDQLRVQAPQASRTGSARRGSSERCAPGHRPGSRGGSGPFECRSRQPPLADHDRDRAADGSWPRARRLTDRDPEPVASGPYFVPSWTALTINSSTETPGRCAGSTSPAAPGSDIVGRPRRAQLGHRPGLALGLVPRGVGSAASRRPA